MKVNNFMDISNHIEKKDNGQFIIHTITEDETRFVESLIIAYQTFMDSYYPNDSLEDVYVPETNNHYMGNLTLESNLSQSIDDQTH